MKYNYNLNTANKVIFTKTQVDAKKLKPVERSIYSIIERIDDFQSITKSGFNKQTKYNDLSSYRHNELKKIKKELKYYSPDKTKTLSRTGKQLLYIAKHKANALGQILQIAKDKESANKFNKLYKPRVLELQRSLANFWTNTERDFKLSNRTSDSNFQLNEKALNEYRKNLLESYQKEVITIIEQTKANPMPNVSALKKQIQTLLRKVNKDLNPRVNSKTQTMRIIRTGFQEESLTDKATKILQKLGLGKNKSNKKLDKESQQYQMKLEAKTRLKDLTKAIKDLEKIAKAEYLQLIQKGQKPIYEDIRKDIIYAIEVRLDSLVTKNKEILSEGQNLQIKSLRAQLQELAKITPSSFER